MSRPILSLPVSRWEVAETRAANRFLRDNRLTVRPTERLAATVLMYLREVHKPLKVKQ
jgi:hypothetical protein